MSNIGIIGSKDMVSLFKILGMEVYSAERVEEARTALKKILDERRLKIVFVVESLAGRMKDEMREAEESEHLTVVPLPDYRSEVSYLDDEIKRLSKEAIGMEI